MKKEIRDVELFNDLVKSISPTIIDAIYSQQVAMYNKGELKADQIVMNEKETAEVIIGLAVAIQKAAFYKLVSDDD